MDIWEIIINYGLRLAALVTAAVLVLMLLRFISSLRRTGTRRRLLEERVKSGGRALAASPEEEPGTGALRDDVLKRQISDFAAKKPENTAKFIRSWLFNSKRETKPTQKEEGEPKL